MHELCLHTKQPYIPDSSTLRQSVACEGADESQLLAVTLQVQWVHTLAPLRSTSGTVLSLPGLPQGRIACGALYMLHPHAYETMIRFTQRIRTTAEGAPTPKPHLR